jgi:hypothetical protein
VDTVFPVASSNAVTNQLTKTSQKSSVIDRLLLSKIDGLVFGLAFSAKLAAQQIN